MCRLARESRRGRCLHRPGRAGRFYGNLRRIRTIFRADVGISPYAGGACCPCADLRGKAVGDDAYIVPAGQTGFTENCGESAPFFGLMWASAPTRAARVVHVPTCAESRRGRCLHRPGRAGRFYGNLRRIRAISRADVGISPYAGGTCRPCADLRGRVVGDDACIVPAEQNDSTEICGESAPFFGLMWASAPTQAVRAVHVPICAGKP